MSPRRHAHSRRRRWDEPRTYNAATGLTGVSEAELAHRTEITEAAMVLAEASAAKAPRFKLHRASGGAESRPPRVFTRPPDPVPSPGTRATAQAEDVEPEPVRPAPSTEAASFKPPSAVRAEPDGSAASGPIAARSPRALAGKLTATVAATEVALAKAVKVAKSDRADDTPGLSVPVPPKIPAARSTAAKPDSTKAPSSGSTSAKPAPKASRAPKGGSRWRTRTPAQAGEANRRPTHKTRPASAPSSEPKARRFSLPPVGRKSGESEAGTRAGAKTPAGTSPSKASRHHPFSRTTAATKAAANKKKPAKPKSPVTPQERRQRIPLVLAAVFAVAVLATSFPLSSLLSQHHQLSSASSQLQQVQTVNRALTQQQHALDSNVAVNQLARSNYQMVTPGQTLYDVLPPSNSTGTTTPGSATSGDPGSQPLVAPSDAPDLSPQPGLPQPIPMTAAGSSDGTTTAKSGASTATKTSIVPPAPATFWGRVSDTLQFWK